MLKLDPLKWVNNRKIPPDCQYTTETFVHSTKTSTFINYVGNLSFSVDPYYRSFTTLNSNRSWSVYFFLDGVDESSKGFFSVYLVLNDKSCDNALKSRVTLKLYTSSDNFILINCSQMGDGDVCGMKKWKPGANYRHTISFKLTVMIEESVIMEKEPDLTDLLFGTPGDIILAGKDWKYTCHKDVLSEFSPVFSAMFKHDMEESRTEIVNVEEIDADVMRSLLSYMYTGKAVGLANTVHKLVKAADRYDIKKLKIYCQNYLLKNLSFANTIESLLTAHHFKLDALKEKCMKILHLMPENVRNDCSLKLLEDDNQMLGDYINYMLKDNLM